MRTIAEAVADALSPTGTASRSLPWAEWRAAVTHADAVLRAVDERRIAPEIGSALIGNAARAIVTGSALALAALLDDLVSDGRLSTHAAAGIAAMFPAAGALAAT